MSLDKDLAKCSKRYTPSFRSAPDSPADQIGLKNLSDKELVNRCIENDKDAWDEFFRRFIPDIVMGIKHGLKKGGSSELCKDNDVIWNIHKKIVKKLYSERKICQNLDVARLRPWLFSMGMNHARDWLKRSHQTKRLPETDVERSLKSLSDPLPGKENLTLGDTIQQPQDSDKELITYLGQIIEKFKDIDNEKLYWALRLRILAYLPLSKDEIHRLANYTGQSLETLKEDLFRINRKLEEKEKEKIHSLARAVILWHEIRHLEAELSEKIKVYPTQEEDKEIINLIKKIEKKQKRREFYLKQEQITNRPSNADIAKILGLPEDKVGQISKIISEARKLLKKKL